MARGPTRKAPLPVPRQPLRAATYVVVTALPCSIVDDARAVFGELCKAGARMQAVTLQQQQPQPVDMIVPNWESAAELCQKISVCHEF